jgi:DNA-binding winged helix-turn-helix (wHTH) protein
MVARDAKWMVNQMAERHHVTFGAPASNLLIELSGGLPAFLKPACTALATGELLPGESAYVWLDRILSIQSVQRNCQEMWDDLTLEEKKTLSAIASGHNQEQLDAAILQYLQQVSLLAPKAANDRPESRLKILSPIFELFVMRQQIDVNGDITLDPRTGALKVNGRTLDTKLEPLELRLLVYLVDHKGQLCANPDLIQHLGEGEQDELDSLVKQLAAKFAQGGQSGVSIQSVEGQGYRLVEGNSDKVEMLHIVIDEVKFQQQVNEIVDSDLFQNLQATAQEARRARATDRETR